MQKLTASARAIKTKPSPIRSLINLANEQKKKGVKVNHFNIGQPDLPTHPDFLKAVRSFKEKNISYAPTQGRPECQKGWITYFKTVGLDYKPTEIIVTSGGVEALFLCQSSLLDAGDELLVFEPFYPYYANQADQLGTKIVPITLSINNGFHLLPVSEMQKKITKRTKAILFCNPSNPTGVVFTPAEVKTIAKFAKKNKLWIIADEVYREYAFSRPAFSMAKIKEVRSQVILCDTASKRFNLCGARVGALATHNQELYKSIFKFAMARESVASIEQVAVAKLLENAKKYYAPTIKVYAKRRNVIYDCLKKIPNIEVHKPEGAFYIIIGLPIKNSEHFAKWLLTDYRYHNTTICVAPAAGFYQTKGRGLNEIRLSYVVDVKVIEESVEILKKALEAYQKKFPKLCK